MRSTLTKSLAAVFICALASTAAAQQEADHQGVDARPRSAPGCDQAGPGEGAQAHHPHQAAHGGLAPGNGYQIGDSQLQRSVEEEIGCRQVEQQNQ